MSSHSFSVTLISVCCSSGLTKALEKAVQGCPVPPVRPKRLYEPASVPPVRWKRLFQTAVRDRYSKVLGSATFCSEPLCSALLCSVHVYIYARVHTSIYTKVLVRRGVLGPSPCSVGASSSLPVRHRQGAQNGCKTPRSLQPLDTTTPRGQIITIPRSGGMGAWLA